jgi:hypothetical protein
MLLLLKTNEFTNLRVYEWANGWVCPAPFGELQAAGLIFIPWGHPGWDCLTPVELSPRQRVPRRGLNWWLILPHSLYLPNKKKPRQNKLFAGVEGAGKMAAGGQASSQFTF